MTEFREIVKMCDNHLYTFSNMQKIHQKLECNFLKL